MSDIVTYEAYMKYLDNLSKQEALQPIAAGILKAYHANASLEAEVEKKQEALERIQTWSKAYPLTAFPKPDLKKAHKVLKAAGMTLDAISADAMHHVLDGVKDIVDEALKK